MTVLRVGTNLGFYGRVKSITVREDGTHEVETTKGFFIAEYLEIPFRF